MPSNGFTYISVQSLGLHLMKILFTITHADMLGSPLKEVKTTKKERIKVLNLS